MASHKHMRPCGGCGVEVSNWRSCGVTNACKVETVYCVGCGGDERATREMTEHMKTHEASAEATP